MKLSLFKEYVWGLMVGLGLLLCLPYTLYSAQWINPREFIGNPMIVRLQQGRNGLSELEKQEVEKYGYTGLEVMSYLDYNEEPGQDNESIQTFDIVNTSGSVLAYRWMQKIKYYYKTLAELYSNTILKPGDIWRKKVGIFFHPPEWQKNGFLNKNFLRSKEQKEEEERWQYLSNFRRVRRNPSPDFEDDWVGSCFTHDDREYRKAWEEEHRILGEDSINGQLCLVIESHHILKPDYYLSKRITWVTKDNFWDLHEEQFDKKGRLYRVVDNQWQQIKPWNYWARTERSCIDLNSKVRGLHQYYGWKFDQGFSDSTFTPTEMQKEKFWRPIEQPPIQIKTRPDFPPVPPIRWGFWHKIGIKPVVVK